MASTAPVMSAAQGQQVTMTPDQARQLLESIEKQRAHIVSCINIATARCKELDAFATSDAEFTPTKAESVIFRSLLFMVFMEKSRLESQLKQMDAQITHLERAIAKAGNMIVPATTTPSPAKSPTPGPLMMPPFSSR